jgi:hypothetical protein
MQRRPTASERAHSSGSFCSCSRLPPSAQVVRARVLGVSGGDLLLHMHRSCRLDVHLPPLSHSLPLCQPPSKSLRHLHCLVWVSWWGAVMRAHHEMTQHSLSHEMTQDSLSLDPLAGP